MTKAVAVFYICHQWSDVTKRYFTERYRMTWLERVIE